MRYGIGIDTGGTFTDAVILELDQQIILSSYKAQTTHDDLSVGILNALDGLDSQLCKQAEIVCLSTTLATNACVEDKGALSKLLFIGVNPKAVAWVGADAGLDHPELICYAPEESWTDPKDWTEFLDEHSEWFRDAQALGIVALNAEKDHGAAERAARRAIRERYDFPVICGYELGNELNSIRRGASALLNGRLIRVLTDFLAAVRIALDARQIKAPIAIMSSDGTLMSTLFTEEHPVETILCGPAASVVGGKTFAAADNAVIVDMGGTTTDIALIRNGVPVKARQGIQIGRWRTAVKGVLVRTLGLGGDSAIRLDRRTRSLTLDRVRVVPLCCAAVQYPQIIGELESLLRDTKRHTMMLHEFFIRLKEIDGDPLYSEAEQRFCRALSEGPLSLQKAADAMGVDMYNLHVERLERENVVIRCGLTPTDIMHLKGDFSAFSEQAARLGAEFVANCVYMTVDELCDWVYDEVSKKLYLNIASMLLQEDIPLLGRQGLNEQLTCCLERAWDTAGSGQQVQASLSLTTPSVLVGVGAPIHVFLPKVASVLGTECVIPEYSGVVNAVGAVACNITVSRTVSITNNGDKFVVPAEGGAQYFNDYEAALPVARQEAEKMAKEATLARGAAGHLLTQISVKERKVASAYGSAILLGSDVTATVIGSPGFVGEVTE